jgi:hypothetical protein
MRRTLGVFVLAFGLSSAVCATAQQRITPVEAKNHVGQQATVCGSVAGVHYAAGSKGQPTFINLDKPYPNQTFTIVIFGGDLPQFGNPEQKYNGKRVCVTGTIKTFKVTPEIVAHDPSAIEVH